MAGRTRRAVALPAVFWDASALVPLCVRQTTTPTAEAFYHQYGTAVWWATPVEIASALARLLRMNSIKPADWSAAQKIAAILALSWSVIAPSERVLRQAEQLVQTHDLRAGDALQLAAALEWCGGAPQGHKFLTADKRLFQAALLCGFDAVTL